MANTTESRAMEFMGKSVSGVRSASPNQVNKNAPAPARRAGGAMGQFSGMASRMLKRVVKGPDRGMG